MSFHNRKAVKSSLNGLPYHPDQKKKTWRSEKELVIDLNMTYFPNNFFC